jgi:hypothetical protein
MTLLFTCDYCSRAITDDNWIALQTVDPTGCEEHIAHFHTRTFDGNERLLCWRAVSESIALTREWRTVVSSTPTASNQSIAQRRRRHTTPGEEE